MPRPGPEPQLEPRPAPTQAITPASGFQWSCKLCGCGWSGVVLAHCASCCTLFADAGAFDSHLGRKGQCEDVSALNHLFPVTRKQASCKVWTQIGVRKT